ncbi:hypothetical protein CWO89_12060 [Bradyrhizobium sp. Leo170]|nr:hypothetical protein CWO89_12060 [Bradyrhizobium sp. Leo170]
MEAPFVLEVTIHQATMMGQDAYRKISEIRNCVTWVTGGGTKPSPTTRHSIGADLDALRRLLAQLGPLELCYRAAIRGTADLIRILICGAGVISTRLSEPALVTDNSPARQSLKSYCLLR